MANNIFSELSIQLGIPVFLLVVIFIWSFVWKLLALWKSAKKNHIIWFIVLALVNTMGILEILYIYTFSDIKKKSIKSVKKKVKKRK
jgi:methionyl-tRNA synthetase